METTFGQALLEEIGSEIVGGRQAEEEIKNIAERKNQGVGEWG